MTKPVTLRVAEIDPNVRPYYIVYTVMLCVCTLFGIVLLPILIPLGYYFVRKYHDKLSVTLTSRTLEIRRGLLTRVESTVPLEKVTDLHMFQGPIMRHFGLNGFWVETAGHATPFTRLSVIGLVDAHGFRRMVLEQRDALIGQQPLPPGLGTPTNEADGQVLAQIRDALLRIEARLGSTQQPNDPWPR